MYSLCENTISVCRKDLSIKKFLIPRRSWNQTHIDTRVTVCEIKWKKERITDLAPAINRDPTLILSQSSFELVPQVKKWHKAQNWVGYFSESLSLLLGWNFCISSCLFIQFPLCSKRAKVKFYQVCFHTVIQFIQTATFKKLTIFKN